MVDLNPTFVLVALPSWLVSLFLIIRLRRLQKAAAEKELVPATVEVKK